MRDEYPTTVYLGAESLRPTRRGDCPQIGSNWSAPSKRRPTPTERLAQDRRDRFADLGHAVAIWTAVPIGVAVVMGLIAGAL